MKTILRSHAAEFIPAKTLAGAAGLLLTASAFAADVVVPSGDDLIVTQGNGYVNGNFDIGSGNALNNAGFPAPSLSVGNDNIVAMYAQGVVFGYGNTLLDTLDLSSSYGTLLNGADNVVRSNFSLVTGQGNDVVETVSSSTDSSLVSGHNNLLENHSYALLVGSQNSLTSPGAANGQKGWYSSVIGSGNQVHADVAWTTGLANNVTGIASTTFGWGLVNPVHSTVMLGTYNETVTGSATAYAENNPALVFGNGSSSARSNAIVTLKNGETTLTNKSWNPADPLVAPTTANMSEGRALVVEGHAVLKGKVILEVAQGDISMGIYE